MKTKLSTRSLKFLAIVTVVAASLNTGVLAQPNPDINAPASPAYMERLDNLMKTTDQQIKYVAPDESTTDREIEASLKKLDLYAEQAQTNLKYKAPEAAENEAIQNLELLTENTMDQLKYEAPESADVAYAKEEKASLTYLEKKNKPVRVEVYSLQDTWLVNAGYYKSNRTPAWDKVKKMFNTRSSVNQYANE